MITCKVLHQPSRGLFSIPPLRATGERALLSDVYDRVAKCKKQTRRQGLGDKIGQVVSDAYERHGYIVRFHTFSNKEVPSVEVFGALVVLGVVSKVDG
eukprot:575283-Pleurochrysis_carterae.AAC.4